MVARGGSVRPAVGSGCVVLKFVNITVYLVSFFVALVISTDFGRSGFMELVIFMYDGVLK